MMKYVLLAILLIEYCFGEDATLRYIKYSEVVDVEIGKAGMEVEATAKYILNPFYKRPFDGSQASVLVRMGRPTFVQAEARVVIPYLEEVKMMVDVSSQLAVDRLTWCVSAEVVLPEKLPEMFTAKMHSVSDFEFTGEYQDVAFEVVYENYNFIPPIFYQDLQYKIRIKNNSEFVYKRISPGMSYEESGYLVLPSMTPGLVIVRISRSECK